MLINSASIESILLAQTRKEGDDRLQALGSGLAWTSDAYTVERFRYDLIACYIHLQTHSSTAEVVVARTWLVSSGYKIQGTSFSLATILPRSDGQTARCRPYLLSLLTQWHSKWQLKHADAEQKHRDLNAEYQQLAQKGRGLDQTVKNLKVCVHCERLFVNKG